MDEDPAGGRKPSSIKPPMIKPPMAAPTQYAEPTAAQQSPSMQNQPAPVPAASNKLVIVINIILLLALIVGLAILAYRWFGCTFLANGLNSGDVE